METPGHIAIIMDGNRRWASRRGLPKLLGHRYGVETFKHIVPAIAARGVSTATFFAFSRENWQRSKEEIDSLLYLFREFFRKGLGELKAAGAKLRVIGRPEDFPADIASAIAQAEGATALNERIRVNVALSYSGRDEIVEAARRIACAFKDRPDGVKTVDEAVLDQHLWTAGLPDVDFLIRTGGERRLSGFLPWQTTYTELYFTDLLWPDFDETALDEALKDFSQRKRNFGA